MPSLWGRVKSTNTEKTLIRTPRREGGGISVVLKTMKTVFDWLPLVSMAPLTHDLRALTNQTPVNLGPSLPELASPWFKFFVYQRTGLGPPSLLLPKGWFFLYGGRVFLGLSIYKIWCVHFLNRGIIYERLYHC